MVSLTSQGIFQPCTQPPRVFTPVAFQDFSKEVLERYIRKFVFGSMKLTSFFTHAVSNVFDVVIFTHSDFLRQNTKNCLKFSANVIYFRPNFTIYQNCFEKLLLPPPNHFGNYSSESCAAAKFTSKRASSTK